MARRGTGTGSDGSTRRATHVPRRRCLGCGERRDKPLLARFTARPQDGVHVLVRDDEARVGGRGLYVCRTVECFTRARERRAFGRGARVGGEVRADVALAEGFESGEGGT